MLVITNTYATEDGKHFSSKNQALIYAALQASGVYLDDYKKKEVVEALDNLLVVIDRSKLETVEESTLVPTLQDTGIPE